MELLRHLSIPGWFNAPLAWRSLPKLISGLPMSLFLLFICFTLANCLGLIIMQLRMSKYVLVRTFARWYISFFRGTPMLVLLFITYFGFNMDALTAAIVSLSVAAAAFVAEYYRAAYLSVPKGQIEVAKSLGMSKAQVFWYVIFGQMMRSAIPALGNVAVDMFKGTSLAAMVTVTEMFMQAKIVAGANQDYMTVYLTVAALYWLGCVGLGSLEEIIERKFRFIN